MQVNTAIWYSVSPDNEKIRKKKIQNGEGDRVINSLPSWFEDRATIDLTEKELSEKILELLNLNFHVWIRKYATYIILYVDTGWFRVR